MSEVDLHTRSKLEKRIGAWHETLRGEYRSLCRISIALYEPSSDVLSTYVYSSAEPSPLSLYEALLADVPSLREIADTGTSRIVNDLSRFAQSGSKHTRNLLEGGIRSSHTIPIYGESGLFGFLFYNSTEEEFFSPAVLLRLQIYTDLISFVALEETRPIRALRASVNAEKDLARHRGSETSRRLDCMARYSRLIARKIAHEHNLTDRYLELLFQLAPLHDVGKIAVPDAILLNGSRLSDDEYRTMKSHVPKGIELVDLLIQEFGLHKYEYCQMLTNIVTYHHADYDGNGYPNGVAGDDIPLEARITRVADTFDALTSNGVTGEARSNTDAIEQLRIYRGKRFDPECVDALASSLSDAVLIQRLFSKRNSKG